MINESKLQEMMGMPLTEDMIQCDFQVYTFVVLQLPKFDKNLSPNLPDLQFWMFFLKKANTLTEQEYSIIIEKKPIIQQAIEKLRAFNFTDEEFRDYEASEDVRRIAADITNELQRLEEKVRRVEEEKREEVRRVEEEKREKFQELTRKLEDMISRGESIDSTKISRLFQI